MITRNPESKKWECGFDDQAILGSLFPTSKNQYPITAKIAR